jgi:hypothetical protein
VLFWRTFFTTYVLSGVVVDVAAGVCLWSIRHGTRMPCFCFVFSFLNSLVVCIFDVSTCSRYWVVSEARCNSYRLDINILCFIEKITLVLE